MQRSNTKTTNRTTNTINRRDSHEWEEQDITAVATNGTRNPNPHIPNADTNQDQSQITVHTERHRKHTATTSEAHESNNNNNTIKRVTSSDTIRQTRARLGLKPAAPINEEEKEADHQGLTWSRIKITLREPFSEFWGVVVMVVLGNACTAQVLLSNADGNSKKAPGGNGFGDYQSINWGWGIGVMLGLYVAGDSGAYLNPAITLSNCIFRQLPWRRFPSYLLAQLLGSFVGSGIVYANYIDAINQFEGYGIRTVAPSEKATAGLFCTFPQAFMTRGGAFVNEFLACAVLVLVVSALTDPGNNGIEKDGKWFPLMMCFLTFGIGAGLGWQTGYAMNPAKDFGGRLMATALGFGPGLWTAGDHFFWIPLIAPFAGCIFGGFMYDAFIYTGVSPINSPWLGAKYILRPDYAWKVGKERLRHDVERGAV